MCKRIIFATSHKNCIWLSYTTSHIHIFNNFIAEHCDARERAFAHTFTLQPIALPACLPVRPSVYSSEFNTCTFWLSVCVGVSVCTQCLVHLFIRFRSLWMLASNSCANLTSQHITWVINVLRCLHTRHTSIHVVSTDGGGVGGGLILLVCSSSVASICRCVRS